MDQPIKLVRERRRDLLMVLTTAILLALSISFAGGYFTLVYQDQPVILLAFGGASLLAAVALLIFTVFGTTEHTVRLRGAIAFDADGQSIKCTPIIGYRFNDEVCEFLRGFLQENAAYAKIFAESQNHVEPNKRFDPDQLSHATIVNSVLEFVVLHQLELHLNSYFVENEIDESRIVSLGRDKLGSGVLKNRVLDQLSKDMTERAAFADETESDPKSRGTVYYSTREDGVVYQRVDVELPPESEIRRNKVGLLEISNRLFELRIAPRYHGFATVVSPELIPTWNRAEHRTPLLAEVHLHIRIKRTAVLSGASIQMYEWLDSFVERMRDFVSIDRLERRLDPDLIKIIRRKN